MLIVIWLVDAFFNHILIPHGRKNERNVNRRGQNNIALHGEHNTNGDRAGGHTHLHRVQIGLTQLRRSYCRLSIMLMYFSGACVPDP